MRRPLLFACLWGIAGIALALTVLSLFGLGFDRTLSGIRISARSPVRPFIVGAAAVLVMMQRSSAFRERTARVLDRASSRRLHLLALAVVCAAVFVFSDRYGSFVASAADSYGYITQAETLAGADAVGAAPSSLIGAWPDAVRALAPLGYVLVDHERVSPSYPPGYPMLMAVFAAMGGHGAMYLVVPVMALCALIATFALARLTAGSGVGVAAALLLACSPVFLMHSVTQMSDVPATAVWTSALAVALVGTDWSALTAGVLVGAAVLIRPNLAPVALSVVATSALAPSQPGFRLRPVLLCLLGTLPGVGALLAFNLSRYGAPLASGYGPLAAIFASGYLWPNIQRFSSWLYDTQTVFPFAGLTLLVPPLTRAVAPDIHTRRGIHLLLLHVGLVYGCYAFYLPFDSWGFLRFLLPALPALLTLATITVAGLLRRAHEPVARFATIAVVAAVALYGWEQTLVKGVLDNERSLRRFVDVPRYTSTLPEGSIFLTRLYSGSTRYYGGRPTVRWDYLAGDSLDAVVAELERRGFVPYVIVEAGEEDLFARTFQSERWGRLDWTPAAEYDGMERVRIFGPPERPVSAPVEIAVSERPLRRQ